jgi:hypothetical protein
LRTDDDPREASNQKELAETRAIADQLAAKKAQESELALRDLSVGVAAAGGVTVQLTVEPDLIGVLRNRSIVIRAGAQVFSGLVGNVSIPRQTAPSVATWSAENEATTKTDQTFDQVGLSPKRATAGTIFSNQLLKQSSIGIEQMVRSDLVSTIATALDFAALYGTGVTKNQPLGIFNCAVAAAPGDDYSKRSPDITFGGPAKWQAVTEFEAELEANNIVMDESCAYITSPAVKNKWKNTPKLTAFPSFLWETRDDSPDGRVNGYAGFATNQISDHRVIFGKWSDCILGVWPGFDVFSNPFSLADVFQTEILVNLLCDVNFRYVRSFAASSDAGDQ